MNADTRIQAQLVLVTGASGGIGSATCRLFSQAGYTILAQHHPNDAEAARVLQDELRHAGGSCDLVEADFQDPAGVDTVVGALEKHLSSHTDQSLRTVVNCAALLLGPGFDDATVDQFDRYIAVNARAPFFLSQALVKLMDPGSSIVNISSAAVHFSSPTDIVYAISKAAVESMTRNMAEAIAPRGIRVNAVIPGFTDNGHPAFRDDDLREYMGSFSILGGVSRPETVAQAIMFLASDAAERCTGSILDISGGSTLGARQETQPSLTDTVAKEF